MVFPVASVAIISSEWQSAAINAGMRIARLSMSSAFGKTWKSLRAAQIRVDVDFCFNFKKPGKIGAGKTGSRRTAKKDLSILQPSYFCGEHGCQIVIMD